MNVLDDYMRIQLSTGWYNSLDDTPRFAEIINIPTFKLSNSALRFIFAEPRSIDVFRNRLPLLHQDLNDEEGSQKDMTLFVKTEDALKATDQFIYVTAINV